MTLSIFSPDISMTHNIRLSIRFHFVWVLIFIFNFLLVATASFLEEPFACFIAQHTQRVSPQVHSEKTGDQNLCYWIYSLFFDTQSCLDSVIIWKGQHWVSNVWMSFSKLSRVIATKSSQSSFYQPILLRPNEAPLLQGSSHESVSKRDTCFWDHASWPRSRLADTRLTLL